MYKCVKVYMKPKFRILEGFGFLKMKVSLN